MGEEHHATIGCIVKDEHGTVHAITNRHVTQNASVGGYYIKSANKTANRHIGRNLPPSERCLANVKGAPDIDIIKIDETILGQCFTDIFDTQGRRRTCRLYNGTINSIYGKRIFKCRPFGERYKCDSAVSKVSYDTPQCARIASTAKHEALKDIINIDNQFIVDGNDGSFSCKGESGTAIALESSGNEVEIVGIICAGEFEITENQISECPQQNCTLCVFLGKGLEFLNSTYGRILTLHRADIDLQEYQTNILELLQCGTTIFFKTPEFINPLAFDLFDRIMALLCAKAEDTDEVRVDFLKGKEEHLSSVVFDRNYFETWIFEIDRGDQFTLHNCYKACQFLYSDQYEEAEKHLKLASWSLGKNSEFFFRLLCKLISYSTWFFLQIKELENMKELLDEGLEFMEDNIHYSSFPKESLPYQYYDYSRYYIQMGDRQNAEEMAKKTIDVFKTIDEENECQDSANRLILAICQFVGIKLGCGEEFESADDIMVSADDIEISSVYLDSIKQRVKTAPIVQKADYLISVCDLEFRKGNYRRAYTNAKDCLLLANQTDMEEEKRWSEIRIQNLKLKLQQ